MTRAASASVRLFVYGSLKRGGRHHDVLQAASARFLGEVETAPGYRLVALDETNEYLALVPAPPARLTTPEVVQGELYEVPESELPALDAFEGDAYIRGQVEIRRAGAAKPRHQEGAAKPQHQEEESLAYFKKAR